MQPGLLVFREPGEPPLTLAFLFNRPLVPRVHEIIAHTPSTILFLLALLKAYLSRRLQSVYTTLQAIVDVTSIELTDLPAILESNMTLPLAHTGIDSISQGMTVQAPMLRAILIALGCLLAFHVAAAFILDYCRLWRYRMARESVGRVRLPQVNYRSGPLRPSPHTSQLTPRAGVNLEKPPAVPSASSVTQSEDRKLAAAAVVAVGPSDAARGEVDQVSPSPRSEKDLNIEQSPLNVVSQTVGRKEDLKAQTPSTGESLILPFAGLEDSSSLPRSNAIRTSLHDLLKTRKLVAYELRQRAAAERQERKDLEGALISYWSSVRARRAGPHEDTTRRTKENAVRPRLDGSDDDGAEEREIKTAKARIRKIQQQVRSRNALPLVIPTDAFPMAAALSGSASNLCPTYSLSDGKLSTCGDSILSPSHLLSILTKALKDEVVVKEMDVNIGLWEGWDWDLDLEWEMEMCIGRRHMMANLQKDKAPTFEGSSSRPTQVPGDKHGLGGRSHLTRVAITTSDAPLDMVLGKMGIIECAGSENEAADFSLCVSESNLGFSFDRFYYICSASKSREKAGKRNAIRISSCFPKNIWLD